jgi:iron-sulfur cluster assembly accessory protein
MTAVCNCALDKGKMIYCALRSSACLFISRFGSGVEIFGELTMSSDLSVVDGAVSERPPVRLTAKAVEMVLQAIANENLAGHGLRVAVAGGGCSGMQYVLDFCNERRPGDHMYAVDGLTVYLDLASAQVLNGTEIDYVSSEEGSGFKFDNPNPVRTCCGCG